MSHLSTTHLVLSTLLISGCQDPTTLLVHDAQVEDSGLPSDFPVPPFELGGDVTPLSREATSTDDLEPLRQIVGDAVFVGLGENIHTSGGQHQVRQRILRYLIQHLGFRAVALETPYGDAEIVHQYVETCSGSSRDVLGGMFGVFASVQMRQDLEWLCDWNRNHPDDGVTFFGFDIQNPWYDGAELRRLVSMADSDRASQLMSDTHQCVGAQTTQADFLANYDVMARTTPERHTACLRGLADIDALSVDNLRPTDRARLRIATRSLRANELQHYHSDLLGVDNMPLGVEPDVVRSFEGRDEGMADTLLAMRDLLATNARTIVIAHNTHLAERQDEFEVSVYQDIRSMGTYLSMRFGESYRAVGISALETNINWGTFGQPGDPPLRADLPDSVELLTLLAEAPAVLVDLHSNQASTVPDNRSVGFGHVYRQGREVFGERAVLPEQFHALVLMRRSEGMVYGY